MIWLPVASGDPKMTIATRALIVRNSEWNGTMHNIALHFLASMFLLFLFINDYTHIYHYFTATTTDGRNQNRASFHWSS